MKPIAFYLFLVSKYYQLNVDIVKQHQNYKSNFFINTLLRIFQTNLSKPFMLLKE